MTHNLRIISSRAPYHRAGLAFAFAPGKTLAVEIVAIADLSEVQIAQLLGDPHLDVVTDYGSVADGALATADELARRTTALRVYGSAEAERGTYLTAAADAYAARQAALDNREAALAVREEDFRLAQAAVLAGHGITAGIVEHGLALRPAVAAAIERNRDEAVDHHGDANTPERQLDNELAGTLAPGLDMVLDATLVETDAEVATRLERAAAAGRNADEPVDADAKPNRRRAGGKFAKAAVTE